MADQPYNAADAEQVEKQKREAGNRNARLKRALEEIMRTSNGRFWIWDLLGRCNVLSTPFDADSQRRTDFGLGQQNVGLQVFAQVGQHPHLYTEMMKENNNGR